MRFNFIGEIEANSLDKKVPFFKKIDGYDGHTLNLICIAASNNRAFLELPGFKYDQIKFYDFDQNEHEIDWEDRFKEEHLKIASNKYVIAFTDKERHEFLSSYDFVLFVRDNIDKIKGKRFTITGRVRKNEYRGKISDRFEIQNMYELADDDTRKNQLRIFGDFFFSKESVDSADWKKEKKIYLNGWTKEYIDKDHKNVYVSKQVIFDCHKADLDNEIHFEKINFQLKQIGLAIDESKDIASKLKKNKHYQIGITLSYTNGNEEIEFDESQLTDNQKQMIKLGLAELNDFKPKGNIYGERKTLFYYKGFNLIGNYADGMVTIDDPDFESHIYSPSAIESFQDVMNPPETEENKKTDLDDDIDDLFGD